MSNRRFRYILYGLLAAAAAVIFATAAVGEASSGATGEGRALIENNERITCEYLRPETQVMADSAANVITDSLRTLAPLMEKLYALRCGAESTVSILHIGDSHVQAGFWTSRVREHFHSDFGNAGRGLIVPYKLIGSNEPVNYAIRSTLPLGASRTNPKSEKQPSPTSVSITFDGADAEIEVWSKNGFNAMTVLHHPQAPMLSPPDSLAMGTYCTIDNTPTSTRVLLTRKVDTVTLRGRVTADFETPEYYGLSLENGQPGVLYHAIGYNGAAFQHIGTNTTILDGGLSALMPDLIIVSLGTNNCYGGNYQSGQTETAVRSFTEKIAAAYPGAILLLTTPRESARSLRRPRETNPNIVDVGRIIKEVCNEKGIACWDMYEATGGKDTNEKWFAEGLANRDRIHLTEKGYTLTADMLYEAVVRYYNVWLESAHPSEQESEMPRAAADSTDTAGEGAVTEIPGITSTNSKE